MEGGNALHQELGRGATKALTGAVRARARVAGGLVRGRYHPGTETIEGMQHTHEGDIARSRAGIAESRTTVILLPHRPVTEQHKVRELERANLSTGRRTRYPVWCQLSARTTKHENGLNFVELWHHWRVSRKEQHVGACLDLQRLR